MKKKLQQPKLVKVGSVPELVLSGRYGNLADTQGGHKRVTFSPQ
jgi:hypothetical protein